MAQQVTRLWLMYPARLITRPVIYELGRKFALVTNIRQASVTEDIAVVSIELDGERGEIQKAIEWLEEIGIKVEPVEINTIEG
jgi:L-aspartate semialdehyde sulfurtransferase ferredoxin